MQRKDGERKREYAGEDGDAEDVHIVLLGGISPDDGVDAENCGEYGVRQRGKYGFKENMGDAELDVFPTVGDKTYGAVNNGSYGEVDSIKHNPAVKRFYGFAYFFRVRCNHLFTILTSEIMFEM